MHILIEYGLKGTPLKGDLFLIDTIMMGRGLKGRGSGEKEKKELNDEQLTKLLTGELDGIPIKETPETFEKDDRVYMKSLQGYASKGGGDYHNQEKFGGIQADKDKQFIFITYLEPHEQISRNPSGQTYDEYDNYMMDFLLDGDPKDLMSKNDLMSEETFKKEYPKPDVVIYQNLNDKKKVPEIGEFIYTTSSNITKHKKVTEIIQEQEKANQREELNKALQGDISF